MNNIIDKLIIAEASYLASESGENKEYDRALVELTMRLLGKTEDDRKTIEGLIGVVKAPVIFRFDVTKVDVTRGPFWTVMRTDIQGVGVGGDHHWLSEDLAKAAKEVYDLQPEYFGQSAATVEQGFANLFHHDQWPKLPQVEQ